jgi:hypothetical protein
MDAQLGDLLAGVEHAFEEQLPHAEATFSTEAPEEEKLSARDKRRIDELFAQARLDRSKAYELKSELDRLDVFRDYEDRFLDLFKNAE